MTIDEVLAILLREKDFVSGEAISSQIGVSRAAVNSAVKALKAGGCEIESVTNKGYRITFCPDRLYAGEVYSYLSPERCRSIVCIPSAGSTNNVLKEKLKENPPEGTCVIANEQTGGRGRMGRTFISPSDTGIYMSILLHPQGNIADIGEITAWTAVAVRNAIYSACGIDTDIKWVNDIYAGGLKVAGILTEMSVEGEIGLISNVIVGIGINVNQKQADFPDEIAETATSLSAFSGIPSLSRARLASEIIREMDLLMDRWPGAKAAYLDTYRKNCITLGKEVTITNYATGSSVSGYALDINSDFSLKVRYPDGSVVDVRSGEVSARL
ncbi:MAG: biotin--[acetyl-CoA-carboxylase] ligase [Clostridiales bacterium]|nr:biotin--[acetyl-CoA-carboxylase] ligase [Clostridiales bacterium]